MSYLASTIVALLPLAAVNMLMPLWLIIEVQLLSGEHGIRKAVGFVTGMTSVRLLQGALFALLASGASSEVTTQETHWLVSGALSVLGLLLVIAGIRMLLGEPDPDAAPPRWSRMVDSVTAPKAAGLGAGLVALNTKAWIFTLSALGIIVEGELTRPAQIGAYLGFILVAQAVLIGLIVACALMPRRAQRWISALSTWLQTNSRALSIGVALLFGCLFLFKGVSELLN